MSDYLNTLVARTLRLGPVVQPRLASFFEPVSPGPATQPAPDVFETHSRPSQPVAERSELTREKKEPNVESSVTNEPARVVLPSQQMRATVLPPPLMPPSVLPSNNTREVLNEELPRLSADTKANETHSTPTPSRIKPDVRIVSTATDRGQIQPRSPAYAAPPSPLSSARNAGIQASTSEEAPETVVVTIGRVDVRAIFPTPAAAPRPHRVQQQAMSLDEYLKQRSEGRR